MYSTHYEKWILKALLLAEVEGYINCKLHGDLKVIIALMFVQSIFKNTVSAYYFTNIIVFLATYQPQRF